MSLIALITSHLQRCIPNSAVLLPLLAVSLLAAPDTARARVIEVGPERLVRTIDEALRRAAVGDEIVLDRGLEFPTNGLKIEKDALEIRSAPGPGAPATIRNLSTNESASTIDHRGEGLLLKDLVLTGGGNVTCVRARGRRLTIDNAVPTTGVWRWVRLGGAAETTIRNCDVPTIPSYSVCAFDADSRGLVIERCTFAGGATESHTIRLQRIYGARLRHCTINAAGARTALSIRDGADNAVENCTIDGRVIVGPLADGDGGIKLPETTPQERQRREAALRRTQANVTLKNCTITTDGITAEMGTQNLLFDACVIRTTRPWVIRLNRDEYEPWRNVPTGRVVHCELLGPAGLRVFDRERPGFYVTGTTINGVRTPDTAPPATQPGSGGHGSGSTPAEVPTTKPATQSAVRRDDVLTGLSHVDAAITELQATRAALQSSTRPAAAADGR